MDDSTIRAALNTLMFASARDGRRRRRVTLAMMSGRVLEIEMVRCEEAVQSGQRVELAVDAKIVPC